jgi:hypothetical protein
MIGVVTLYIAHAYSKLPVVIRSGNTRRRRTTEECFVRRESQVGSISRRRKACRGKVSVGETHVGRVFRASGNARRKYFASEKSTSGQGERRETHVGRVFRASGNARRKCFACRRKARRGKMSVGKRTGYEANVGPSSRVGKRTSSRVHASGNARRGGFVSTDSVPVGHRKYHYDNL